MTRMPTADEVRAAVRSHYANALATETGCCGNETSCCGPSDADRFATALGYDAADLAALPDGANLGLSCGNPHAIAAMREGETVIDLGSGAGFDCFLASRQVGPHGQVIGIDFTPEMVQTARASAAANEDYANTEFRLGEIEHLPLADASVDVAISNCVINLSPDKPQVMAELMRVLKPGGRIAFSDVVATAPVPDDIRADLSLISGCLGAALPVAEWRALLENGGFVDIQLEPKDETRNLVTQFAGKLDIADIFVSALIHARKPA